VLHLSPLGYRSKCLQAVAHMAQVHLACLDSATH